MQVTGTERGILFCHLYLHLCLCVIETDEGGGGSGFYFSFLFDSCERIQLMVLLTPLLSWRECDTGMDRGECASFCAYVHVYACIHVLVCQCVVSLCITSCRADATISSLFIWYQIGVRSVSKYLSCCIIRDLSLSLKPLSSNEKTHAQTTQTHSHSH